MQTPSPALGQLSSGHNCVKFDTLETIVSIQCSVIFTQFDLGEPKKIFTILLDKLSAVC